MKLLRRLLSSSSISLKQRVLSHRLGCLCMGCMAWARRALSSSSSATQRPPNHSKKPASEPSPKSQLLKTLDNELAYQRDLMDTKGEGTVPSLPSLLEDYHQMLTSAKWEIKDAPGSATVDMVRPLDGTTTLTVRFDVRDVVEGSSQDETAMEDNEAQEEDDEVASAENEGGEEEDRVYDEADEDYMEQEHIFPMELELCSTSGQKKLILDVEYNADLAEKPLVVTNAAIMDVSSSNTRSNGSMEEGGKYAYTAPQYDQLDEELRASFDAYANRLLHGDALQFISDYAFSKEATQYGKWLEDVKGLLQQ